jgi:D-xylonolactonase
MKHYIKSFPSLPSRVKPPHHPVSGHKRLLTTAEQADIFGLSGELFHEDEAAGAVKDRLGMPELTSIADYQDLCGECPVWDAEAASLYWIDCVGLKFLQYDWRTGQHRIVRQGFAVNGFRRNRSGGFVLTNNDGVWLWDGHGDPRLLTADAEGSRCQLNDCTADPAGRLIAGSYFYNPAGEYQLGKLIRIDTNGRAIVLDEGFHLSNGLGFSPDARRLYFADSVARMIYAYDYDVSTGSARNRRVLVQVPREEGLPDGLAVDAEGFVWSAQWYGNCVVRYDPDGKLERRIQTPAKQTSSVAFGGPYLTDIFITSAGQSEPMPIMPPGYDPASGYFGGALYHVNPGIPGQLQHMADMSL